METHIKSTHGSQAIMWVEDADTGGWWIVENDRDAIGPFPTYEAALDALMKGLPEEGNL